MREHRITATVVAIGLGIDLLSFIGWSEPAWLTPLTVVILFAVAVGAFLDIRIGAAAVLLELLWGSHGYLLRIPGGGVDLSLRMGLFLVVLTATVWHLRTTTVRRMLWSAVRAHPARWPALAFLSTLALAVVLGLARHQFDRVFFDANAWTFLLLAPAFVLSTPFIIHHSSFIILAGSFYLILRTYFLLFLFTHDLGGTWIPLYQWIRDTRLGEITMFPGAFPRIFLPSMVLLFPTTLLAIQSRIRGWKRGYADTRIERIVTYIVLGGGIAVLLVSLSRSYWLAGMFLLAIGAGYTAMHYHKRMIQSVAMAIGAVVVAIGLAVIVVRLPYPPPLTTASFGATLATRLQQDAAVSNRWQQLGPLWTAIRTHFIFGNGFGAAVTYESKDPRTLATLLGGQYTTTAFEWGYLDDLLERGFLGLIAELWFIGALTWYGLRAPLVPRPSLLITRSLALGLLAIAVIHATSPYLNHPLGIGALILLFTLVAKRDMLSLTRTSEENIITQ